MGKEDYYSLQLEQIGVNIQNIAKTLEKINNNLVILNSIMKTK